MKKNQAVLKKVERYRERKGLKIIDTDSMLYKAAKALFIIGFIWLAAIHLLFFCGQALILSDTQKSDLVYMEQFYILCATAAVTIAGFVLMLCKKHLIGGIFNLAGLPIGTYQFYVMLVLRNQEIDSMTKFVWRHLVPALIMFIAGLVMCIIAFRAGALLNRDYKRVLEALYITHKDRLRGSSEEEWEALLAELDDNALEQEMDRQHTREYKKKKEESLEEASIEINE